MTYKVSLPKEETLLDEFCQIRKSEKLTIETYHSMRKYCNAFIVNKTNVSYLLVAGP